MPGNRAFVFIIPDDLEEGGAADVFLEMIMQPFLGFVCIVPGSSNLVIV